MRFRSVLLVASLAPLGLLARRVAAQTPDTARRAPAAGGATIDGVVWDSLANAPLPGAVVQLVADGPAPGARTAVADSLGRFTLDDVPTGRYTLGFLHPLLDSLGIQPPLRQVDVAGPRRVRADLAIPAPARLRAAICGPRAATDSGGAGDTGGVVVGVVRSARDGAPLAGATVAAEWLEISFTRTGLVRQVPRVAATTGASGWFALCNLPAGGTMTLVASRGADSTDRLELSVPAEGFLHRELSLGPARTTVVGGGAGRSDSLTPAPRLLRTGDGRLTGTVTAIGGRPLAGAEVGIADGPRTRANDRGEWTLMNAPAGTRMLEVRAVGFYPERRPVDVVADAAPVRVTLSTLAAVLDTVKVRVARLTDRHQSGFEDRRHGGMGHYVTAADIARRQPIVVSDMFRMVPGVRVVRRGLQTSVIVRGGFTGWCTPAIYIDGQYMSGMTADDVDGMLSSKDIAGIEIYTGGMVPAQYQQSFAGCGSLVYWTK